MPSVKTLVTQGGNDTTTSVSVPTGLTVDGKAGWEISGIRAFWKDIAGIAAADYLVQAYVGTETGALDFAGDDRISTVGWALQNTAGTAVAVAQEPLKSERLMENRVTVQPEIFVTVESTGTSNANDIVIEVFYDIVKLSDLEVLRLFAGGA